MLWVEMPETVDSIKLYELALRAGITIAPGRIFSAAGKYSNCLRLNAAFWSRRIADAVGEIGELAKGLV